MVRMAMEAMAVAEEEAVVMEGGEVMDDAAVEVTAGDGEIFGIASTCFERGVWDSIKSDVTGYGIQKIFIQQFTKYVLLIRLTPEALMMTKFEVDNSAAPLLCLCSRSNDPQTRQAL